MQSWNPSVKGVTHNWKGSNCFGSNIGTMVFVFAFVCILLNMYVFVIDHHVYQYIKVMYYTAHITNLYLFLYLYFVFGHNWSSCISLTPRLRLALPKGFERSPIADPSFLNAPCNQDLPLCSLLFDNHHHPFIHIKVFKWSVFITFYIKIVIGKGTAFPCHSHHYQPFWINCFWSLCLMACQAHGFQGVGMGRVVGIRHRTRRHSTSKLPIVPYSKQPAALPCKNFEKWHRFCPDLVLTPSLSLLLTRGLIARENIDFQPKDNSLDNDNG